MAKMVFKTGYGERQRVQTETKGGVHKDRKKDAKKYQSRKKGLTQNPEREIL